MRNPIARALNHVERERVPILETVAQDVRYASRALARNPGYSVVAAITLALGVGANVAVFSLVNAVLLRPLPYPQPDRLVEITGTYPRGALDAMRKQVRTMRVAVYARGYQFNLTGRGEAMRLKGTLVSAELLDILGVRAALGRTFGPGEDAAGRDAFAVLSHTAWQRRFGGDPAIVGRTIVLDGVHREVLGVMPAGFAFPAGDTDVWIPLHVDASDRQAYWASDFMPAIGRLEASATITHAAAELRAFQTTLPPLFPWAMPESWNADSTVRALQDGLVADVRGRLLLLVGVCVMVLAIACANVANLTLARAGTRAKEIGVRTALGAGRGRIAQQLLTESLVLAALGTGLGVLLATQGLALLARVLPAETPGLSGVAVDWRALAAACVLAVVTGLSCGVGPALQSSRAGVSDALAAGGRGASAFVNRRLRRTLAVAEIAAAVLLAIAAGLLVRSLWALSHVETGFTAERIVASRIAPNRGFCDDVERCLAFYAQTIDRVRVAPGVTGAALVNTLPLTGDVAKRSVVLDGLPSRDPAKVAPLFWLNVVTPDYFRVMDVAVIAGRAFTDADRSSAMPVAIVPRATARRYWGEETAIGQRIRFVGEDAWHTIVGIVEDVRAYDLRLDVPDFRQGAMYVPFTARATLENGQLPAEMTMVVSTSAGDRDVAGILRSAVAELNADVPIADVRRLGDRMSEAIAIPASVATLFSVFAGLALVLGAIGIYGVLAYLVSTQTPEIGIRLALGAQRTAVLWSVAKEGLQLALAGVVLGIGGALVATRALAGELYGVSTGDPATYLSVAGLMVVVSLVACAVPTYRATRIDPVTALRGE
jgi:predicted permease